MKKKKKCYIYTCVSTAAKYKMYIISFVGMSLLVGRGNSNTEHNDIEMQDGISYDEYRGYWSYEGQHGNRF